MTQISVWGPLTWYFFHTLAEKIKDEHYDKMKGKILDIIKSFCNSLPCDECAAHATSLMNKVSLDTISTKPKLQDFLFNFHNNVSMRTKKPPVDRSILDIYKNANLKIVASKLYASFHTKDKKYMMNEFNRCRMLSNKQPIIIEIIQHCDP